MKITLIITEYGVLPAAAGDRPSGGGGNRRTCWKSPFAAEEIFIPIYDDV